MSDTMVAHNLAFDLQITRDEQLGHFKFYL